MKFTLTLAMAALAAAAPAPAPTPAPTAAQVNEARQLVSGGLGGVAGQASGTAYGILEPTPELCGGGAENGQGATLCARDALPTPEPIVEARQLVSGGLGGVAGEASGTAYGILEPTPELCGGGAENGQGATLCARDALPTPEPVVEARQLVSGGLGGVAGQASGTAYGILEPTPELCGGGAENGQGATLCARDALPTPEPVVEARQLVSGGLGGVAGQASGTAYGILEPTPELCGGGAENGQGATLCARSPEPTPAPVLAEPVVEVRQVVSGGLGGVAGAASGTAYGILEPTPELCGGGAENGQGATLCVRDALPTPAPVLAQPAVEERQVLSGGVGGVAGAFSGTAYLEGAPTPEGCLGGADDGSGETACLKKRVAVQTAM